jgi:hypothetical protein
MSVVFSGSSGFPTNKTGRHDIAEILLKVALNTIKSNQTKLQRIYKTHDILCVSINAKKLLYLLLEQEIIKSNTTQEI